MLSRPLAVRRGRRRARARGGSRRRRGRARWTRPARPRASRPRARRRADRRGRRLRSSAEEAFARDADEERVRRARRSASEIGEQRQVVARGASPKPMPGSTRMRSRGDARGPCRGRCASRRNALDLGDDVLVARRGLHRRRRAVHVHRATIVGAALGDERQHGGVEAAGADVVDDARAGCRAPPRRPPLWWCRSRSGRRVSRAERRDHRHDPRALFVGRDRRGAGARRLAADVEQVGAFREETPAHARSAASGSAWRPPS